MPRSKTTEDEEVMMKYVICALLIIVGIAVGFSLKTGFLILITVGWIASPFLCSIFIKGPDALGLIFLWIGAPFFCVPMWIMHVIQYRSQLF